MPAVRPPPQGLYTLQATQSLLTVSRAQQEAAFSAMGLSLAAYEQAVLPSDGAALLAASGSGSGSPDGSSSNSTAGGAPSGASSAPPLRNAVQANTFNLSHPLTPAVVAANAQLTGLFYAARWGGGQTCRRGSRTRGRAASTGSPLPTLRACHGLPVTHTDLPRSHPAPTLAGRCSPPRATTPTAWTATRTRTSSPSRWSHTRRRSRCSRRPTGAPCVYGVSTREDLV